MNGMPATASRPRYRQKNFDAPGLVRISGPRGKVCTQNHARVRRGIRPFVGGEEARLQDLLRRRNKCKGF